jgi:DNA-binding NarL/FixJ family response regulator
MPRVVIVDDDPNFRSDASAILGDRGYDVVGEAGTLAEARGVVAAAAPDLVLLDVHLPDGEGFVLAEELCGRDDVRVLLTSTDAYAAPAGVLRDCGAAGFVPKTELASADLTRYLT